MFPRRFYPARMFAPRYWPQSQGASPVVIVTHMAVYERPNRTAVYERPNRTAVYRRTT